MSDVFPSASGRPMTIFVSDGKLRAQPAFGLKINRFSMFRLEQIDIPVGEGQFTLEL